MSAELGVNLLVDLTYSTVALMAATAASSLGVIGLDISGTVGTLGDNLQASH